MNYNHYKVEIDGRDCTAQVPFPIKFSQLLDEQLDEASISIIRTKRKMFNPLTPVKLTLWNGNTPSNDIVLDMVVASDKATELPVGSGKFNHDLYLIEETKILEGFIVRSHGYVNTLRITYERIPADPIIARTGGLAYIPLKPLVYSIYKTYYVGKKASFPSPYQLFGGDVVYVELGQNYQATSRTSIAVISITGPGTNETFPTLNGFDWIFTGVGTYTITYKCKRGSNYGQKDTSYATYTATYMVNVVDNPNKALITKEKWNALTVLRRALEIAEPLLKNDNPRFTIDGDNKNFVGSFATQQDLPVGGIAGQVAWVENIASVYQYEFNGAGTGWTPNGSLVYPLSGTAQKIEHIETPEFQFTQSTLREILQGIGGFIHAEPRLKNGVIFYDFYGSGEQSEKVFKRYGSQQLQLNIERFATGIDSSVDNLTNSLGYAQGAVVEPFDGGYKNVVTESLYTRIDETNCFASTTKPIRKILKLLAYIDDGGTGAGHSPSTALDITDYVYESADYAHLSSYSDNNSKALAIYYTTGEKNIKGLNVKVNVAIFQSYELYSIINILRDAGGNGFGSNLNSLNIAKVKFNITYEPITSARIKQSKPCIVDTDIQREISYTQGQNLVESRYYGEHLKGVIARMGNPDKVLTVVERGLVLPPKIGTIYEISDGDYYVSASAVEINTTTTKITLTLSKDFNKYSDYVGINSMKRQYEISEKQAFDSHFNYRDYCVIGDYKDYPVNSLLFNAGTSDGNIVPLAAKMFTQKAEQYQNLEYRDKKISCCRLRGLSNQLSPMNEILLPVISLAMGNSAVFTCKYEDNYSAGTQAIPVQVGNDTVLYANGTGYTDFWGEIEYLNAGYYSEVEWVDKVEITNTTAQTNISNELINETSMSLPACVAFPPNTAICGTVDENGEFNDNPILLKKGSTEVPTINYQIDFVANRNSIVIGSALAKNLPMVSGLQPEHYATLYVLQNRINKFEPIVDLSSGSAMRLRDYSNGSGLVINNYKTISFNNWSSSIDGKAWALVDNATGELLIGENKEIKAGENVFGANGLHISFTHDIYKKGE